MFFIHSKSEFWGVMVMVMFGHMQQTGALRLPCSLFMLTKTIFMTIIKAILSYDRLCAKIFLKLALELQVTLIIFNMPSFFLISLLFSLWNRRVLPQVQKQKNSCGMSWHTFLLNHRGWRPKNLFSPKNFKQYFYWASEAFMALQQKICTNLTDPKDMK